MPREHLVADDLRAAVVTFRDLLRSHQDPINRLNVYPVPDGDTGTNMALTVESVVTELDGTAGDMAATCKAIGHASLMGARGNSGVILCQVLRGLTNVLADSDEVDGSTWAGALTEASTAAYGAVGTPVEGTILTVVREASEAGAEAAADGASLVAVLDRSKAQGADALTRTPDMLPVLKEAGVVDAGGAGFLLLLDALLHVLDGRPLPEPDTIEVPEEDLAKTMAHAAHDEGDQGGIADLRYEVMYLLEATDGTIPAFKDVWAGIGDSIVVVGGDGLWNCHIHTDDIGAAVEAALDCGRPRNIRVTDLLEQVEEERWVRDAAPELVGVIASTPVPTAVVAVCTGDGIRRIFHSLGVQGVVLGGQTMNPSTAQLLEVVEAVPADAVVILPNNKNIIAVARQVDAETEKTVRVVPTKGAAEGFAALLAYDPKAAADENAEAMGEAAASVIAGEVTRAVRESSSDAGPIHEGDYLGISGDGIQAVADSVSAVAIGLLDVLVTDEHEIVTIIEGEGSTVGATRHIREWLEDNRPDVETEVHHGGQPLYPYYFGIE
ncbi:MAG TPA: DAK2 domain-containing protein [Acidimicrobiales bacterium]